MIKSQDDLNEQKRQSGVLLEALDKCERFEELLRKAKGMLTYYSVSGNHSTYKQDEVRDLIVAIEKELIR